MSSSTDEKFMQVALKLAAQGGRAVAPNPMVGAVIVKDGEIIGKGHHQKFGGSHAEVNAIKSVKNKKDLEGATLYATLEPCQHQGKTGPCLLTVEEGGFKRVVIGSKDPFQKGKRPANWEFMGGKIEKEARELNKFYFTWVEKKRPYITVKVAMSADGFVAGPHGETMRFTTTAQDKKVHALRAQHQAIMVGVGTVLTDDPALTVRLTKGEDPLRVIVDSKFRTPLKAKVLKDKNCFMATLQGYAKQGFKGWESPTKTRVCLSRLLKYLAKQGISSVLVEPGPTLYKDLKRRGVIDEELFFVSKKKIGKGLAFPRQ